MPESIVLHMHGFEKRLHLMTPGPVWNHIIARHCVTGKPRSDKASLSLSNYSLSVHIPLNMRPKHTQHTLSTFPVYSSAFLSPTQLVLGGGGGASKTGIKNKIARPFPFAISRVV